MDSVVLMEPETDFWHTERLAKDTIVDIAKRKWQKSLFNCSCRAPAELFDKIIIQFPDLWHCSVQKWCSNKSCDPSKIFSTFEVKPNKTKQKKCEKSQKPTRLDLIIICPYCSCDNVLESLYLWYFGKKIHLQLFKIDNVRGPYCASSSKVKYTHGCYVLRALMCMYVIIFLHSTAWM